MRKKIPKLTPLLCTGIYMYRDKQGKKERGSRKTLPYLKGTACCKMTGCSQYVFSMAEEPTGQLFDVTVSRVGEAVHPA